MIVLTGSIATGKSSVCRVLKGVGFEIVDADKIAKELIDARAIESLFGSDFVKNGTINTKALGNLIFADLVSRERLNNYIHPLIREEIHKRVAVLDESCSRYVVDIPLYFETKSYDATLVCVVYCPKSEQLKRVMKRDDLTKLEALNRIESQIDIERKREMADFIIDNSKDEKHLMDEIEKFIRYLDANFKI